MSGHSDLAIGSRLARHSRVIRGTKRELISVIVASGLVVCGTTGENATISDAEHRRLIALAVETARDRVPVIAGCGSNDTVHAVELTEAARDAGAAAALHVPPYYNRPNQDGMAAHIEAVADLGIPIVLYNVPGRTITEFSVETVGRLSRRGVFSRFSAGDRAADVPNCSVTSYRFDPAAGKRGKLRLELVNFVAPLEAAGTPVTVSKDVPAAPKA